MTGIKKQIGKTMVRTAKRTMTKNSFVAKNVLIPADAVTGVLTAGVLALKVGSVVALKVGSKMI